MLVLASSSAESAHDPPQGVLGPVVVMNAFPRHGEQPRWLSYHHRCEVLGFPSRSDTHSFHRCLFFWRFE